MDDNVSVQERDRVQRYLEETDDNIRVEYDKRGEIIGVEIYNISRYLAKSIAGKLKEVRVR